MALLANDRRGRESLPNRQTPQESSTPSVPELPGFMSTQPVLQPVVPQVPDAPPAPPQQVTNPVFRPEQAGVVPAPPGTAQQVQEMGEDPGIFERILMMMGYSPEEIIAGRVGSDLMMPAILGALNPNTGAVVTGNVPGPSNNIIRPVGNAAPRPEVPSFLERIVQTLSDSSMYAGVPPIAGNDYAYHTTLASQGIQTALSFFIDMLNQRGLFSGLPQP